MVVHGKILDETVLDEMTLDKLGGDAGPVRLAAGRTSRYSHGAS
jgi:hypothetical protein